MQLPFYFIFSFLNPFLSMPFILMVIIEKCFKTILLISLFQALHQCLGDMYACVCCYIFGRWFSCLFLCLFHCCFPITSLICNTVLLFYNNNNNKLQWRWQHNSNNSVFILRYNYRVRIEYVVCCPSLLKANCDETTSVSATFQNKRV